MPQLPKQYLQSVTSQQISAQPSLINSRAAGSIRGPRISTRVNIQAPKTAFAPQSNAELARAVESAGQVIGKAGAVIAEKDAEREAQDAALVYEEMAALEWLGTPSGEKVGYAALSSKHAARGLRSYQDSLAKIRGELADNMGDAAKSKFLAKTQQTYTAYRNRGAQHAVNARSVWDKELKEQSLRKHFQSVNEELTAGNMDTALARIGEFIEVQEQGLPEHIKPAAIQNYHKNMVSFLASTEGASQKIGAYQNAFSNSFDMTTQTSVNNTLIAAVKQENQETRLAEADAERDVDKAREANDLRWFQMSFDPNIELNMERGMQLVESGRLSPSTYLAVAERRESKSYLPTISAEKEIELKRQLVNEDISYEEAIEQVLEYDDGSVRRLGNFAVNTQGYAFRNDLRYGYDKIESAVRTNTFGYNRIETTLAIQRAFEKNLKKLGLQQALDQALTTVVSKGGTYIPQPITFSDGTVLDPFLDPMELKTLVDQKGTEGSATAEELDAAYGEILRIKSAAKIKPDMTNSKP